jgi:prepilin-type N-terminal cleavage/methylation domain-containing protein
MTPMASLRKKLGFTMVEVLTTLMVISVVVRLGIPNYHEVRLKAEAVKVLGDFNVVRQAANVYMTEHNDWPQDLGAGQVPPELTAYLPPGFSFGRGRYQLDWEHWVIPSGLPGNPDLRAILGLSIVTEDRALGAALDGLLGSGRANFSLGPSYTFILETR